MVHLRNVPRPNLSFCSQYDCAYYPIYAYHVLYAPKIRVRETFATDIMNSFTEALLNYDGNWRWGTLGLTLLGAVALFAALLYPRKSQSKYPLPPGPKGYPLIGNIPQVPVERSDIQFAKWSKEYSESFQMKPILRSETYEF